ncbi:hypothetical protein ANCDUO_05917 [Ancylostoma duodenale]|uniref:Tc1-like transposase DDE domain-containing protein n=1 Tax=Ancylostoma duodenale TaxID=51022 RepID=A0A0C2DMD3_9BILA|nr:hypothetical protein ANCDUO_05917 [Ancylostoma duodenale]
MVWAGVSATGRTPLIFVEKGAKIIADFYLEEVLKKELLPWSHEHFKEGNWTFQQDGPPAHKSKKVQKWCRENLPEFLDANDWPANSTDLNVMDYSIWAILEEKACAKQHGSVDALKISFKKALEEIPQETLRAAVESYPKRLKAVIKAKGGHIE